MVGGMAKLCAGDVPLGFGDGSLPGSRWDDLDIDDLARKLDHVRGLRAPDRPALRTVIRVSGSMSMGEVPGRRKTLAALAGLQFDEDLDLDPPWHDLGQAHSVIAGV